MPIKYNLNEKGNPRDPDAPKKWYAQAKSDGDISRKSLGKKIVKTIYRLSKGKVFSEYEIRFKDKKIEYTDRENIVMDFMNSPSGRIKGINRINESDKYLFINIGVTVENNTIIGPGNYDNYICIHIFTINRIIQP